MESQQTPYVADKSVPPAESSDSQRSTGPLWALAGLMTGKHRESKEFPS